MAILLNLVKILNTDTRYVKNINIIKVTRSRFKKHHNYNIDHIKIEGLCALMKYQTCSINILHELNIIQGYQFMLFLYNLYLT